MRLKMLFKMKLQKLPFLKIKTVILIAETFAHHSARVVAVVLLPLPLISMRLR